MFKRKKVIAASKDFDETLLPRNRKEQFKFILKTRKSLLFTCGAMLLVFALPLLISLLFKDYIISNFYKLLADNQMDEQAFYTYFRFNEFIFSLIQAVTIVVFSIGLAGVFNVYKKLVFGEPVFFKNDFKNGIKSNIKSYLSISLVIGLFVILFGTLIRIIGFDPWIIISEGFFVVILLPILFNMFFYKSVYLASIKQTIHNSLLLLIITHIKGIGLSLLVMLIPLTSNILAELLIITPMINEFILVFYFIVLLPLLTFIMYVYYYSIFDEKINQTNYPSSYRKGLYDLNDGGTDYEN